MTAHVRLVIHCFRGAAAAGTRRWDAARGALRHIQGRGQRIYELLLALPGVLKLYLAPLGRLGLPQRPLRWLQRHIGHHTAR